MKNKIETQQGFKFNFTEKEKAIEYLEEEKKEMESKRAYKNIMNELGLKIIE